MKTLAELQMELELGLMVYHVTNAEMCVWLEEREVHPGLTLRNVFFYFLPDEILHSISGRERELVMPGRIVPFGIGYETLDALLADWPIVTSEAAWTTKAPERVGSLL